MIQDFDLCIIGGGINGAGIARDAAGRGLRVLLVEKGDLASGTSSVSTGIIHGGIRYLEYWEFKLVRDSLKEREVLLGIAPHIVHPMTFVMPHTKGQRPVPVIKTGLFLYDHLAKRNRLEKSHTVDLKKSPYGAPLQEQFKKGFTYSDCRTYDSRLVVLNAMDAAMRGASILTRTECIDVHEHDGRWHLTLKDFNSTFVVSAGAVINAAGAWVRKILEKSGLATPEVPNVRLVKGSHILVPKLYEGNHAYTLQQPDKRIVFMIPSEGEFTQVGTTDVNFTGDPAHVQISEEEIMYLCAAINRVCKTSVTPADVIWHYSGVRSLFDDGKKNVSSVTRDYHLHLHEEMKAPMISVFGGKLTTYRVLSERVVDLLQKEINRSEEAWTAHTALPGGDIPHGDFPLFVNKKKVQYPWLPEDVLARYARSYGTWMDRFLEGAQSIKDLGRDFGSGLYDAEIFYLVQHEFARTTEDILWRRSKLGLKADEKTIRKLEKELPRIIEKVLNL